MTETEQLIAIEAIKHAKARYCRGVDTGDTQLVRDILHEACELDYRGCLTDPTTGRDYMPAFNIVIRGRDSWSSEGFAKAGIVSVHQSYNFDVTFAGPTHATAICAMTDRLFMPAGAPFAVLTGYGYYHEEYESTDSGWKLKRLRISRLRVATE